jgi:hypothetical protein
MRSGGTAVEESWMGHEIQDAKPMQRRSALNNGVQLEPT